MDGAKRDLAHVPALDGVRAIAVSLVVLFHIRVAGFGSGFLGVDIFFVLSGFLITSLLLAEIDRTGRIALTAFWSRRVRRLFPALVVLLLVVAGVTAVAATFTERASIRGDLLSTTTYVANWHFIGTSSYFANNGVDSPLHHAWSLAIEEQFYLVWPLVLFGLVKLLKRPRAIVAVLGVIGAGLSAFALSALWLPGSVDRAYMGTDSRIFEPLVGAIGAALIATPRWRGLIARFGTPLVAAGSLGLVAALTTMGPESSIYFFGGAVAVSVCTLLVIAPLWIGRAGRLQRALELRPVVWLGAISYGVYLWHWPFVVWLRVPEARGADLVMRGLAVVVLTLAVSAASYHAIERPIRRGRLFEGRAASSGLRVRRLELRRGLALVTVPPVMLAVAWTSIVATTVPPPEPGVPVVMLVGDSVPLHLENAFEKEASSRGWRMVSAARGACSVSGERATSSTGRTLHDSSNCPDTAVPLQNRLLREAHPDVVVWWDRWSVSDFLTAEGEHVSSGTARFWELRRQTLRATVHRLAGRGARLVFVAVEPPGLGVESRCGAACSSWVRFQIAHFTDITSRWNAMLRRYAALHPRQTAFVSLTGFFCHDHRVPCDDRIDGVPARPDGTHYEGVGQDLVTRRLATLIAPYLAS